MSPCCERQRARRLCENAANCFTNTEGEGGVRPVKKKQQQAVNNSEFKPYNHPIHVNHSTTAHAWLSCRKPRWGHSSSCHGPAATFQGRGAQGALCHKARPLSATPAAASEKSKGFAPPGSQASPQQGARLDGARRSNNVAWDCLRSFTFSSKSEQRTFPSDFL